MEERTFGSSLDEAFDPPTSTVVDWKDDKPEEDDPLTEDTTSLLYLGYLKGELTVGTHTINIRTLRVGEEFEAAFIAKKYEDTVEAGRALATALVAAAITSVDGNDLIAEPLGPGEHTLEGRYQYILRHWYWPTIQAVYTEYGSLVRQASEAFEDLKKV